MEWPWRDLRWHFSSLRGFRLRVDSFLERERPSAAKAAIVFAMITDGLKAVPFNSPLESE